MQHTKLRSLGLKTLVLTKSGQKILGLKILDWNFGTETSRTWSLVLHRNLRVRINRWSKLTINVYNIILNSLIKEISWRTSYNSLWGQNVGAIYVNRKQVYRKTIYILQLLITVSETNLCIWATIKLCRFIVIFQII